MSDQPLKFAETSTKTTSYETVTEWFSPEDIRGIFPEGTLVINLLNKVEQLIAERGEEYARGRSDATRALLAEIARKIPYPVKDCICVWCGDVGARAHSDDCLWKRAQREAAPSPEEGEG